MQIAREMDEQLKARQPDPEMPTMRDMFAMFVVSGHVSRINVVAMPPEEVAGYVYRVADAMLEERKPK